MPDYNSELPGGGSPLLIRTDFEDNGAWHTLTESISGQALAPDAVAVTFVNDQKYSNLPPEQLVPKITRQTGDYFFVVDSSTFASDELPVLLVPMGDDSDERQQFRVAVAELTSVSTNLDLSNMDWDEFINAAGPDHVFRGFAEPPESPAHDDIDVAAAAAIRRLSEYANESDSTEWGEPDSAVSLSRTIAATPDQVFERVLAYPSVWLGLGSSTPHFQTGTNFDVSLHIDSLFPGAAPLLELVGEVIQADPARGCHYQWVWRGRRRTIPSQPTDIVIDLASTSDGGCRTDVRHRNLPADLQDLTESLWTYYLRRLEALAVGEIPWGQHPWFDHDALLAAFAADFKGF